MKHSRIILSIAIVCSFSLIAFTSQGQTNAPFLEGGVLVTTGGYSTGAQGTLEQSVGQVAYTIAALDKFTLEQGVLHAFYADTPPPSGKEPGISTTPVESHSLSCNIYPNPCASTLNVEIMREEEVYYQIVSATGTRQVEGHFNATRCAIPVQTLSSGLYIIILQAQDGARVVKRFIKE